MMMCTSLMSLGPSHIILCLSPASMTGASLYLQFLGSLFYHFWSFIYLIGDLCCTPECFTYMMVTSIPVERYWVDPVSLEENLPCTNTMYFSYFSPIFFIIIMVSLGDHYHKVTKIKLIAHTYQVS